MRKSKSDGWYTRVSGKTKDWKREEPADVTVFGPPSGRHDERERTGLNPFSGAWRTNGKIPFAFLEERELWTEERRSLEKTVDQKVQEGEGGAENQSFTVSKERMKLNSFFQNFVKERKILLVLLEAVPRGNRKFVLQHFTPKVEIT